MARQFKALGYKRHGVDSSAVQAQLNQSVYTIYYNDYFRGEDARRKCGDVGGR